MVVMVPADPAALDLRKLFQDPSMFDSRSRWAAMGFQVFNRSNNGKIMVARHLSVQGLLFKKYTSDLSQKDQLKNYERRLEGAQRLRTFMERNALSRLVVPRKWIVELPIRNAGHILVVEQLDLRGDEQTKAAYQRISLDLLRELCLVLFHFRGMDSNAKNLPFVGDDRIGLIDTEHWDRATRKAYLYHVGEYLSSGRRKVAKKIFRQLEHGERVSLGDLIDEEAGSRFESFANEEFTSDSQEDFFDEEDTSVSSESSASSSSS